MSQETRISQLIVRYLCGELSDKEREELHAWIEARESHRRLFRELCSLEAVKEDVRAREAVDLKTAVEAMRRRIQESEALKKTFAPLSV